MYIAHRFKLSYSSSRGVLLLVWHFIPDVVSVLRMSPAAAEHQGVGLMVYSARSVQSLTGFSREKLMVICACG
jgi:hypothetical protein